MKKLISIFFVFVISAVFVFPSFAAQSIKFTVSDSEVFAGDEFTVDIFISDYSQLKSATLLVEYDKNSMQFLDLNVGAIVTAGSNAVSFKDIQNVGKSYIQIDYNDSSASLSSAGKFISLTFVAGDTAVGEKDVKMSVSGNKVTVKTGTVTPEFKNGKIKIINNNPVTDSKTEPSSVESTASESSAPENTENVQNTPQNTSENPSESKIENSSADKNNSKENTNKRIIVGSVVTAIIVIAAMLCETKGNKGKRKKNKSKKRKTRR